MPRFEKPYAILAWFREIYVDGNEVWVYVSEGEPVLRRYNDKDRAAQEAESMIEVWLARGFEEVGPEVHLGPAATAAPDADEPDVAATLVFKRGRDVWSIRLEAEAVWSGPGKVPSEKQVFESEAAAKAAYDTAMVERYQKGYELTKIIDDKPSAKPVVGSTASAESESRSETLDAELEATLDLHGSTEPFLVYADWLQRRDEPRGQLIALDCRVEDATDDAEQKTLYEERVACLRANRSLYPYPLMEMAETSRERTATSASFIDWSRGFVSAIKISMGGPYGGHSGSPLHELVATTLRHPAVRLLQELTIGANEDGDYRRVAEAIGEHVPQTLRTLWLAHFEYTDSELSWSKLGHLGALWPRLPTLDTLRLRGDQLQLGDMDLPRLTQLEIESTGLSHACVESITARERPFLESLKLWLGVEYRGGDTTLEHLEPIFAAEKFPALRHLGLMNSELADEIAAALVNSPVLKQLESVDLSRGVLSDDGALELLGHRDKLGHLKSLDLSDNQIPSEHHAELRTLCPSVSVGDQRVFEGEAERYVSVSE